MYKGYKNIFEAIRKILKKPISLNYLQNIK